MFEGCLRRAILEHTLGRAVFEDVFKHCLRRAVRKGSVGSLS